MTDDEEWHVYPSGLAVKGKHHPRIVDGVDTLTGEKLGPQDLTPEEAEARSVERRRQRAQSIFTDPIWPADRVVSWIGYRDVEAIEEPFAPALYADSRPVVEGMPRIALLHALQEGSLRAIRQQGKLVDRIHPDEWAHVRRDWSIDRWHECLFARSDVLSLWPEVKRSALIEAKAVMAEPPAPAPTSDESELKAKAALKSEFPGSERVKGAGGRLANAARKEATRRIVWEQVEKLGRGDLLALLLAVREEQGKKNMSKLCEMRVLKEILKDGSDVYKDQF